MSEPIQPTKQQYALPETHLQVLAKANGICPACYGKKVLPARIQYRDGRPCSIEERPCPKCQP